MTVKSDPGRTLFQKRVRGAQRGRNEKLPEGRNNMINFSFIRRPGFRERTMRQGRWMKGGSKDQKIVQKHYAHLRQQL